MNDDREIIIYRTKGMLTGSLTLLLFSGIFFALAYHMWREAPSWRVMMLICPAAVMGILGLLALPRALHFAKSSMIFTFGRTGKWIVLGILLLLTLAMVAGCAPPGPPQTSLSDPLWQLNDGRWSFGDNALISPPGEKR